jgi:Spy/CpxP family protein refolding chaperone
MKRLLVFALALLAFASTAGAIDLPPGKWWRRAEVIQVLNLTEDQQTRLDGIFRGAANDLIDMKADVEKANVALRGELDQPQLNRDAIRKSAARVNDARARLFERELMMLVDMRAVLTDTQWNRMRQKLDQMKANGPLMQQRPNMRRRQQ